MTDVADADRSAFDTDVLATAQEAAERFGFSEGARLTPFPLTENWTYRVEEDGGREPIVLRIYRPNSKLRDEIRSELAWMTALRTEAGVPVPPVLSPVGASGEQIVQVARPEPFSPVWCTAFAFVPGTEPPDDDLPAWFPRLGELMARMHQHARGWARPAWFTRMRWDLETTLGPKGHWGPWHASVPEPDERRQMQRLADVVVSRLQAFGVEAPRFGLVHADLRLANVLVDGERLTVLDFDDCGDSWYLYDLAATLTFNEGRPDVDDLIASWVDAYRRVEELSSEDEAEIKTFLMLRRLMLSAYVGLRADTDLAAELREARFSTETCHLAEAYLATHA